MGKRVPNRPLPPRRNNLKVTIEFKFSSPRKDHHHLYLIMSKVVGYARVDPDSACLWIDSERQTWWDEETKNRAESRKAYEERQAEWRRRNNEMNSTVQSLSHLSDKEIADITGYPERDIMLRRAYDDPRRIEHRKKLEANWGTR